jgi:molecular chaperone GrpE (heat shock protein)
VAPVVLIVDHPWAAGPAALFAVRDADNTLRGTFRARAAPPSHAADMVARLKEGSDGSRRPRSLASQRIEQLEQILEDHDAKLREAVALYDQEKREHAASVERLRRESKREVEISKEKFLGDFLEVLDDLDRAVEQARRPGVDAALREGLELVVQRFMATLARHEVTRDVDSTRFDPKVHDAVAIVPVAEPEADGAIVEILRPGYFHKDRVLRPARVVVGKAGAARQ